MIASVDVCDLLCLLAPLTDSPPPILSVSSSIGWQGVGMDTSLMVEVFRSVGAWLGLCCLSVFPVMCYTTADLGTALLCPCLFHSLVTAAVFC